MYDPGAGTLTLHLTDPSKPGIYHLTDGGSSGLGIPGAESYTFFGTVLSITPAGGESVCVIKINGREKRFPLATGDFKFTCDGVSGVLNSIDVYFIIPGDVVFNAGSFGFNTGRYRGNNYDSYPSNYIRMRHKFYHKESVIMYYQPLFENEYELAGKEIVLLDSRLYTIGIANNRYYAKLKAKNRDILLESGAPITGGLHQYAVVYDFSSVTFRFYIDGRLEGSYSGQAFGMPDFVGVFPEVYNITPGGNMMGTIKAEGIIDEMRIVNEIISEGELQDDFIRKTRVIRINQGPLFSQENITLQLENNTDYSLAIHYSFDSGEQYTIQVPPEGVFPVSGNFALGNHLLVMDIDTGSITKREIYRFVVSYAPVVHITESRSIIVSSTSDFSFWLERDIANYYAEQKEFIELKLFLSESLTGLETGCVQTIKEDRVNSNYGLYYRDNDPGSISSEIRFKVHYTPASYASSLYYRIKAYYVGREATPYSITGGIKILDIENPVVEYDSASRRAFRVYTNIVNFNPSEDSQQGLLCSYQVLKLDEETQEFTVKLETGELSFNKSGEISINVYRYS